MARLLTRLLIVAVISALVAAAIKALRGDAAPQFSNHPSVTGGPAASPPIESPKAAPAKPVSAPAESWADPVDEECPDGFPVKAKLSSGIFHVPGGQSYDRTAPDRCYRSADLAEADGLRAAKR